MRSRDEGRMGAHPANGQGSVGDQRGARVQLLRRLRIAPRVLALLIVPTVMLLTAIGLAAAAGQQSLRGVEAFQEPVDQLVVTVDLLDALAAERWASTMPGAEPGSAEVADARSATEAAFTRFSLDTRPGVLGENVLAETDKRIRFTRRLADIGSVSVFEKQASYDDIIIYTLNRVAQVAPAVTRSVSDASRSYIALINAHARASMGQETNLALLRAFESGAAGAEDAEHSVLTNFAIETTYLRQFLNTADPASVGAYQSMMDLPAWRTVRIARDEVGGRRAIEPSGATPVVGIEAFTAASGERNEAMRALREAQLDRLRVVLDDSIARSQSQLIVFGLLAGLGLLLFGAAALAIRRSVASPLTVLVNAADSLAQGRVSSIDDTGKDELGAFASAFRRLHDEMTGLWEEADDVRGRVESGEAGARFDIARREGDWRRLVRGFNDTLSASEAASHRLAAEASRRQALARITNSAVVASSPASVARAMIDELGRLEGVRRCLLTPAAGQSTVDHTLSRVARAGGFVTAGTVTMLCDIEAEGGPLARVVLEFEGNEVDDIDRQATERTIEAACRMIAETHRRHEAETQVRYQTEHDLVTGLPTIDVFESWVSRHMTDPSSSNLTVLSLGVMNAPIIKTTLGQHGVDQVLKASAKRLREVCGPRAMTAQADSYQFLVGLPGAVSTESRTRSIIDALCEPILAESGAIDVRVSGGYAIAGYFDEAEDVITNALAAGVEAMRPDTPNIVAFRPQLRTRMARALELERWFDTAATQSDMLSIWYQPIVDAQIGEVVGYEALARGFDAAGGSISPAEFVPVLEESGRIGELGQLASTHALEVIERLPGAQPYVSVNVSPAELRGDDILQRLDGFCWDEVDRSRLALEITEGLALIDDDELVNTLQTLRDRGHSIIIDDFGTGYSSLAYLNRLPVTSIKLDRSLILNIDTDEAELAVATGAIEMAHAAGLRVVAEGVERVTQLEVLRGIRCDYVQGFLTGRPSPVEATAGALRPLQPYAPETPGFTHTN